MVITPPQPIYGHLLHRLTLMAKNDQIHNCPKDDDALQSAVS